MIILRKIQLGKISMDKMDIGQGEQGPGRFRMVYQMFSLFDSEKLRMGLEVCPGQAEFSYPAADIQNPGPRMRGKEPAHEFRNKQGRPVQTGQQLNGFRIEIMHSDIAAEALLLHGGRSIY